jgi:enoyl-CoA hydratase/carnithine racemase
MGLYVALTGARLGASDLLQTGLATHYVTSDRLADLEKELIENCPGVIQGSEPYSNVQKAIGDILDRYHYSNLTQPDDSKSIIKQHAEIIETVFVKKISIEEIIQTLDAERTSCTDAEKGKWIQKTLATLLKSPPVSLKLTLTLLSLAENHLKFDLKRCLEAEYKVMMHCLKGTVHEMHRLLVKLDMKLYVIL